MKGLELKVYPLAVLLVCLVLNQLLVWVLPLHTEIGLLEWIWPGLLLCGLGLPAIGVWQFKRASTTVDPTQPAKSMHLVTEGVYAYTRNPMYLGFLLLILAQVCWLGELVTLCGCIVFVVYIQLFQINPEQRLLKQLFGEQYTEYCQRVRPWL